MINIQQFKALQKKSQQSFYQQKKLIQQLLSGQEVFCQHCQQKLLFTQNEIEKIMTIYCQQGCTNIELTVD